MTDGEPSALDVMLGAAPRRQRWRHSFSIMLLAIAATTVALLFGRFVYGTASPYYTSPVERGDITPTLALRGILQAAGEVTLVAAQDGTVVRVPDPAAARVRAGEDLVTMDTAAMNQALEVDTAVKSLADATLARAGDALRDAQVRLDRYQGVWRRSAGRVPSLNEMENARASVANAEIDRAMAETRRQAAMQAMIHDRAALANAVVRAPFAGFLVACRVNAGQVVRAGQALCTIAEHPERLTMVAPISATDGDRLQAGGESRVLIDGLTDQDYSAKLLRINAAQSGPGGGKVAVFALIPPAGAKHARTPYPGLGATAQVDLAVRTGVLLVPNAALMFSQQRDTGGEPPGVYLARDDDTPRRVPVAIGASDGRRSEVLSSALHPGNQVIIGWRVEDSRRPVGKH